MKAKFITQETQRSSGKNEKFLTEDVKPMISHKDKELTKDSKDWAQLPNAAPAARILNSGFLWRSAICKARVTLRVLCGSLCLCVNLFLFFLPFAPPRSPREVFSEKCKFV